MFEIDPRRPVPPPSALPMLQTDDRYAVVISDVHIGTNTRTCWYQPAHHEARLIALLRWIVAQRKRVREVVLLGDLFDFWTYLPTERPPSMGDIIAKNPSVLGPGGALAEVVKAFPGKVRMLRGNHDMGLTQADVDTLNRSLGGDLSQGQQVQLIDRPMYVVTGASGARTVFAHGHHSTMFNAPDARSPWGVPSGHFVSRAIAFHVADVLSKSRRPVRSSADLDDHGNPSPYNPGALMKAWAQNDDLAKFALAFFCNVTRMQETQPITMSDRVEANRRTPTVKEAKTVFAGIRALWRSYYGRDLDALRAATADAWGDDLAWFAQRLALKHACDLAVMGHTHKPVAGVAVSPVNYINTGYLCVAGPDTRTKQFTFAQVDLERATAQVLAVTGGVKGPFKVEASRAPVIASVILGRYSDFSCYARIDNRSDRPLRRVRFAQESASFWVVPPPEVIAPRTRACVWLQDKPGVQGSAGRFTYTDGSRTFEFVLECPTGLLPNIVRSPVPGYLTRTGSRPWRRDGVDRQGHPLQVRFVVEALRPAGRFAVPPSAPAPAPPRPRVYTA